jgi:glycosyltransferase involved in cell wall biosynthesis
MTCEFTIPPLVSIVIPCRNGAQWLAEAIESCLGQSWTTHEIIVVDNGSSDRSLAVARQYEPAVVTLQCHQPGASAARNIGLQRARGDFIQFLDADDVLDHDKIEAQLERLVSGPPGAVATGAWARFQASPHEAVFAAEPVSADLAPEEFLISSWHGGGMMPSFAWLTPRAVIDRAGPWNERLSLNDDGEFFCRVVLASSGIVFCGDARGYYRSAAGATLSRRRDKEGMTSAFDAIALSCDRLLQHHDTAAARAACATHYQRFVFDAYPEVPELVAAAERRIAEFGGSELRVCGGRLFSFISRWFGWKIGKRCQLAWRGLKVRTAIFRREEIAMASPPRTTLEPIGLPKTE